MRPDSFVVETLDSYLRIKLKHELTGIVRLLQDKPTRY